MNTRATLGGAAFITAMLASAGVSATTLPCAPCAGVLVDDPTLVGAELARAPTLGDESLLFVAWTAPLDGTADPSALRSIRAAGAEPWVRVVFRSPRPIGDHLDQFEDELRALAALARDAGGTLHVEAVWRPTSGGTDPREHAFILKRAAVVVTGATPDATFVGGPLEPDPDYLTTLYQEEVAAYLDAVALAPSPQLSIAVTTLSELDPGKPIALDALPWPADPTSTLVQAAEMTAAGIAVTFFEQSPSKNLDLAPLKILAREFRGDLTLSEGAAPRGARRAWAFVRGSDLGLQAIVETPRGRDRTELVFDDRTLRSPRRVDLATGETTALSDVRRTSQGGLAVSVDGPDHVMVLGLERRPIEELDGFDERIDVSDTRQIPVEEILRRLQAFEDDQDRRLDHYQAVNTLQLRFQAEQGSVEVSYRGDFFYSRGKPFDWVWKDFFFSGIKWRSKRLPEVPLIQPEKVASLPVEIRLTKDYSYRLRGTATIDGRDCWVIDFKPIDPRPGRSLYQGTVWVDREISARVRSRAIQVGLEGEVLSNEETVFFSPVDEGGLPAAWSGNSFILPLRLVGQQTLSVLSITLPVEREINLTDVRINGAGFAENREAALASDATMVRDTDQGLQYLRKDTSGQRVVDEERDTNRLFLLGGVFWDESVDYPLPLAGVNYLDFDVKGTGNQLNVFFAGALLNVAMSDPDLFGSRWNGGANLSGIFFKRTDELYRDGVVVPEEEVESRSSSGSVFVGRPIADFLKLDLTYRLRYDSYSASDDASVDFVVPQDTLTHTFETGLTYAREGYRVGISGSFNSRSDWEFWGLPENPEYDPGQKDFTRWRATFAKTWWLPKFRNITVFAEHLDGENLDRFSGYDFGIFGDSTVAGYQSGLVRAHRANGLHLSGGVNYLDQIRFDAEVDAVWASNETTGLDNELLAGIGIGGSLTLPWQLVTNFEIGYALAGPGEGNFAARIFFLRLFPRK
jgi:hypothetical protein